MKQLILFFCLACLVSTVNAQDDDEYGDAYSSTLLNCSTFKKLSDIGPYMIVDTLEKPLGYIMKRDHMEYLLVVKEKKQWVAMQLETFGVLDEDSTRRVNLNDQGNNELVLSFSYYSETETSGSLEAEVEESSRIYIYDLDKKELIIDFVSGLFYKKVEEFYVDATGARIDKEVMHDQIYQGARPEQKDSLDMVWESFLENSKSSDVKNLSIDGSYILEKNRITLNSKVEKKDFGGTPVITESHSVYVWKDNEWMLLKAK